MTKNKTKWRQEKESTKKFIVQIPGCWIGIMEADKEKEAKEMVLRTVNKLREEQDCIFSVYKNTFETCYLREEWVTKGLRIRKGYIGFYCVVVVDGVKRSEGWLDYVYGFKPAYNKIRRYINENYSEDAELILYIDLEHRDCKRPTEDDEGYLKISIKEAVKHGSGIGMGGILKGIKELGIGDFSKLYGVGSGLGDDEEDIGKIIYIKEENGKLKSGTIVRKNVLDILGLTDEEREIIGKFKLESKEVISLSEVVIQRY